MRHRRRFKALAFGVRARDGGAIGILSITNTHTDKNGLGHVEGSKLPEALRWKFFSPISMRWKLKLLINMSPPPFGLHCR